MARIPIDNLPGEYREKLRNRGLTRETIAALAVSVSKTYLLRKRAFKKVAILLPVITIFMMALSFFAPATKRGSTAAIGWATVVTLLVEVFIMAVVYCLIVNRVPRQFAGCLKKGYPELEMEYGYEQITNGSLASDTRLY